MPRAIGYTNVFPIDIITGRHGDISGTSPRHNLQRSLFTEENQFGRGLSVVGDAENDLVVVDMLWFRIGPCQGIFLKKSRNSAFRQR
ncbi:hypothetical protein ES705_33948 [subsurface metagenome]